MEFCNRLLPAPLPLLEAFDEALVMAETVLKQELDQRGTQAHMVRSFFVCESTAGLANYIKY